MVIFFVNHANFKPFPNSRVQFVFYSNEGDASGRSLVQPTLTRSSGVTGILGDTHIEMESEAESEMKQLSLEEEDAEWERAEGIPQPTDPFIQKFFQGRDGLILQEDKHRSGS